MKNYRNKEELAHAFAHQITESGKASSIYFEGKKIYSFGYHYLLGEIIGNDVIMINTSSENRGGSSFTSKHRSALMSATRHMRQFFTTDCDPRLVSERLEELVELTGKARKPQRYISCANSLIDNHTAWIKYNRDNKKPLRSLVYGEYPKKIKSLSKLINSMATDADALKEFKSQEAKKAKKARNKAKKIYQDKIHEFLSYETNRVTGDVGNKEDYLRISRDGENVETSQGIIVSVQDAKILYRAIKAGTDIRGHKIGHYRVTSINGVLTIGCHRINIKSVHTVGEQLMQS